MDLIVYASVQEHHLIDLIDCTRVREHHLVDLIDYNSVQERHLIDLIDYARVRERHLIDLQEAVDVELITNEPADLLPLSSNINNSSDIAKCFERVIGWLFKISHFSVQAHLCPICVFFVSAFICECLLPSIFLLFYMVHLGLESIVDDLFFIGIGEGYF